MKVAVVGATGLVGRMICQILEERNFPLTDLIPVASARSRGTEIFFKSNTYPVCTIKEAIQQKPDIAIFSAGKEASLN